MDYALGLTIVYLTTIVLMALFDVDKATVGLVDLSDKDQTSMYLATMDQVTVNHVTIDPASVKLVVVDNNGKLIIFLFSNLQSKFL